MKKTAFLACTLAVVLMLAGCQESKVEEKVEAETKTEVKKEVTEDTVAKAPSMSKEEVTTLITTTLETVKSVLDKAWDENNWNSSAEADLNVFKEMLKDVTSEEFVDTQIKNMMDNKYYEGTDIRYIPYTLMTEIRLDIKQEEQRLEATTFEPGNLINSGASYTFTFDYIDDKWVLQGWKSSVPNLGLTIEESQKVLETYHSYSNVTYKAKKQTNEGNLFVFSVDDTATVTFNSNTTEYTEDYPEVKKEENPVEEEYTTTDNRNTTIESEQVSADSIENGFKKKGSPSTGLNNKDYYLNYIKELKAYIDSFGQLDKTSDSYLPYAEAYHSLIDDVFYEMVGLINNNLDGDKMEQYRQEQSEWGSTLDQGVRNIGPSELDFYEFESKMYEERCIEIANKYMN